MDNVNGTMIRSERKICANCRPGSVSSKYLVCTMGKTWRNNSKYSGSRSVTRKTLESEEYDVISNNDRKKSDQSLFYIDKGPDKKVPSTSLSTSSKSPSCSSSSFTNECGNDDNNSDDDSNDGNHSVTDEEFALLVTKYQTLMSDGGEIKKDLEWTLDENAARILRKVKVSNPRYAQMSREEFDKQIHFDEIYGKRHHRTSLRGRLQRVKDKGRNPDGSPHTLSVTIAETLNFKQLNRDIKDFVRHEDVGEQMELDPYPPIIRRLIHELAHMYGLQSSSRGQGVERHCVLIKGDDAHLPRDLERLDRFLERAQKTVKYACDNGKSRKRETRNEKISARKANAKVAPGSVVGCKAAPIEETNVGNQMLRKLGWSPGQGLGSEKAGRTEPVSAVYRGNRAGLGG